MIRWIIAGTVYMLLTVFVLSLCQAAATCDNEWDRDER